MNPRWRKLLQFTIIPASVGIGAVWLVISQTAASKDMALWDSIISVVLFTLMAMVLGNILKYYRPSNGKEWNVAVWILLFSLAWTFGTLFLLTSLSTKYTEYQAILYNTIYLRFFISLLVLTCLALVTWVRQQTAGEVKAEKRVSELRQLSKDTELNALRQQLQPHFLFNSLNSIQALTSSDPLKAKQMVIQLSDFLRGTLRKENDSRHSIEEELAHSKLYLEIEKVRFGDRLLIEWDIDEAFKEKSIPAMVLQPLLENAIKHGIYQITGPVKIKIQLQSEANFATFLVTNPYDPAVSKATTGAGFGLSSLARRLFLLFEDNNLISTTATDTEYTVKMKIPLL